jgi:hypothetical protein
MAGAALAVSIIAMVITGVGWFVSHWLNSRTQKQALVNSLTNEARITLTDAIRDFHDWCCQIRSVVDSMPVDDMTSLGRTADHHETRKRRLLELSTDPRHTIWLRRLEEYETLFPETAHVRVEILDMLEGTCDTARRLADQHEPGVSSSKDDLDGFGTIVFDILALAWDILVHVQNSSIGRITGHKIAERVPKDAASVRLTTDNRGLLRIGPPNRLET